MSSYLRIHRDVIADRVLLQKTVLAPLRRASDTLSAVGQNPVRKAVIVSLPTIESAFVMHTTKGIQGWEHPDYPVLRVVIEVLNATESFLWVCNLPISRACIGNVLMTGGIQRYIRGSGLAYGAHCSLDLEAGFINFSLYRVSGFVTCYCPC